MELSVLVKQTAADRFRAWCDSPVIAEAEGMTRDEALTNLSSAIGAKLNGAEVARVVVGWPIRSTPIWPDDEITRAWLEGITATRAATNKQPDSWELA